MMKKIQLIIWSILVLCVGACTEDKGDYDYIPLNDLSCSRDRERLYRGTILILENPGDNNRERWIFGGSLRVFVVYLASK